MAAQDFRHLSLCEGEKVADFMRQLERTFQLASAEMGCHPRDQGCPVVYKTAGRAQVKPNGKSGLPVIVWQLAMRSTGRVF